MKHIIILYIGVIPAFIVLLVRDRKILKKNLVVSDGQEVNAVLFYDEIGSYVIILSICAASICVFLIRRF
jgi:hypothetical protein